MKNHICPEFFCPICAESTKNRWFIRAWIFAAMLIIILALLASCTIKRIEFSGKIVTLAKDPQGYDLLGLAMYCDNYLASPTLPAVSTLLATFGNPMPCIEKKILQGGITAVQVDARDATCWRNKVCPPGTPSLTDWNYMLARVQNINQYAVKYPQIAWWISPYLEHDFKDDATILKACSVVKQGCPTCRCINTPTSGSARPPGIPVEEHGTKVRGFSVSGDGGDSADADNIKNDGNNFQHRLAGSNQTYYWVPEFNLRCSGEKTFTPPKERTAKPPVWMFRMAHKIMMTAEDPFPAVPPQCMTVRQVAAPEIIKPLSESYCNGQNPDVRGNKPLLIIRRPGKSDERLPILRPDGQQIGCARFYGTLGTNGLYRYYVGNCSGQNPWELSQALGQEWGYALLGNGSCLRFNSLRRQGVYK